MHNSTEKAVERAIDTMRIDMSQQLTVDDMARAAMFSKFHFTRVFQRVTGVSPGRFLSAMRLQAAKRLLVTTSLNVTDISMQVGYNSVGTFSTRFSKSVGLSPTEFRRTGGYAPRIPTSAPPTPGRTRIAGGISAPAISDRHTIFLGLFPQPIPEGAPIRCAVLPEPGTFRFDDVPDGTWYLLCHAMAGDALALEQDDIMCATVGPIHSDGKGDVLRNVPLKRVSKADPPVLLALLDTRKAALDRLAASA
ncbi:AraC family transcriptional regulator [Actinoplanes sp. ATCC 53533]|uniref:helix-turn-helix transcriptional regulator n=1 Tax=Actinoplanes sp. ATCC 53533 TaxID=1288362 RepID=UPI000F7B2D80|nr:helix-turn-helix transcriptional regulator [Actinoplanes sp. ATCC 53533]RSM47482.1 AraC family transcriptional regulator [Actinoplanes sp. ATCC 53533]